MTNSVDPDQTAPDLGPLSLLLYLNESVMLGIFFAADDFSRRYFSDALFLGALRVDSYPTLIFVMKMSSAFISDANN